MISAVSRPSAVPAAARRCERSANWSCSSRAMSLIFAIFSADSPIVSPVVGSAMAGVIGTRSRGRIARERLHAAAEASWRARPRRARRESARVQDRNVRQRLGAAGDDAVGVAEHDLVGGVGDRLVGRRARAARRCTTARLWAAAGSARPRARCSARAPTARRCRTTTRSTSLPVDAGALNQLGDAQLAEFDRRERLEGRARAREGGANAGDDGDPSSIEREAAGVVHVLNLRPEARAAEARSAAFYLWLLASGALAWLSSHQTSAAPTTRVVIDLALPVLDHGQRSSQLRQLARLEQVLLLSWGRGQDRAGPGRGAPNDVGLVDEMTARREQRLQVREDRAVEKIGDHHDAELARTERQRGGVRHNASSCGSALRAAATAWSAMSTRTTWRPARAIGMAWRPMPPAMSATGRSLGSLATVSTIQRDGGLSARAARRVEFLPLRPIPRPRRSTTCPNLTI